MSACTSASLRRFLPSILAIGILNFLSARRTAQCSPMRWLALVLFLATAAQAQNAANGLLLVAKPGLIDPNFRETVVLVSQTEDGGTVGVILNRPTSRKLESTGESVSFGGPVMREVLVVLFRSEQTPEAAFHVLKGIW